MAQNTRESFIDFASYIADHIRDFRGRDWVLAQFDRWLATVDAPRYFIITGEPGIGKTAIAAWMTQHRELAAMHFCIPRQVETLDPLTFVRSLSHQLTRIEGFAKYFVEDINAHIEVHINVQSNYGQIAGVRIENLISGSQSALIAFNRTVITPLKRLYAEGFKQQLTILVDALDEAAQQHGTETIVDLLASTKEMPSLVRFVLTSRPESGALRQFEQLHGLQLLLNAEHDENVQDIRDYVRYKMETSNILQERLAEQGIQSQALVDRVVTASQGNFLFLVFMMPALINGTQPLDASDAFPKGLDGIYRELLRTRIVGKDIPIWRRFYRPLLGVLAVAQIPISAKQLAHFTQLNEQEVNDVLLDTQQFLMPSRMLCNGIPSIKGGVKVILQA